MTALHDLSASELVARYRERSLSPVEVTRAVLDRIAAWEPHLHATYALDPDAALASARVSEARWLRHVSAGENVGALEGVPAMIKENIATTGTPVPLGTAATELTPALRDAPPAARLREAGAVVLGKTTMPDYGMLSSGLSSFHGVTRNPWDLSKNPGGSSSGAAAGVAAGYGPLHLGTDIGGSVRLPAGWRGVFTLKPSLGRIPIDPPYPTEPRERPHCLLPPAAGGRASGPTAARRSPSPAPPREGRSAGWRNTTTTPAPPCTGRCRGAASPGRLMVSRSSGCASTPI